MDKDFKKLLLKLEKAKGDSQIDLSAEEDLSLAIMNLISLEEHFFFTAQKTAKDDYLDLLNQTRQLRKELMSRMFQTYEGETWCVAKHLLAATMRLMEVGTKLQADGKIKAAKQTFDSAYKSYSLFWAIRLRLITLSGAKSKPLADDVRLEDIVNKLVDCCKE